MSVRVNVAIKIALSVGAVLKCMAIYYDGEKDEPNMSSATQVNTKRRFLQVVVNIVRRFTYTIRRTHRFCQSEYTPQDLNNV